MAKKLLVKTPQTKDGVTLLYDGDKKVVYRQSIVELGAKRNFESLNARLPEHLKHELSEVEVEDEITGSTVDQLKKKIADLETGKEVKALQDRIAELEAEKAGIAPEPVKETVKEDKQVVTKK